MKEVQELLGDLDVKLTVYMKDSDRHKNDYDEQMEKLTQRIDKAESDRMQKYYKQVSELQDWVNGAKQKVEDSCQLSKGLVNFFGTMDSQAVILNSISEVLTNSLEGRQLNNFIDYMQVR